MSETPVLEILPFATPAIEILERQVEISKALTWAEQAERNLLDRLASLWETRVYYFEGDVNYASAATCIKTLGEWSRIDKDRKEKRIHIVLNGHAHFFPALTMAEFIRSLQLKGFYIIVEVAGAISGQAALILAAADHRLMTVSSWIKIDQVSIKAVGTTYLGELEVGLNHRLDQQTSKMLCGRSAKKLKAQTLKSRIKGKTWEVNSDDALKYGFIDAVSTSRPEALARPAALQFAALPSPNNISDELKLAYIRKMRAEAHLFELQNADIRNCDANNGVVRFFGTVTTEAAKQAKIDLQVALRVSASDINVHIYSDGGNVTDGWGFTNLCQQVGSSGRAIITDGIGQISSIAGVMLQAGTRRRMSKNSWLMIHRVGSTFADKTTAAELEVEFCQKLERHSFELLASRSVFTVDEIMERCRTNNWWITAADALKWGFIDEVY
jgi:ATP-dependent protease ClpP protease subunit